MERLFRRGPATFFDIGANVGIYTYMACAQSGIQTYAFEPLPINVEYIRNTVARNGLTQVTVAPLALADMSGSATFYVPIDPAMPEEYNADMSSLINRFEGSDRRHRGMKARQITVPVSTLDEYVLQHGIDRVDIVKLDVEEAELQVLHGASRTLERLGPDITCELLFENPHAGDIFRLLTALGYSGYLITKFGLIAESEPLMIRQRGGNERLALWNDHFFSRRSAAEIRRLSTEAFGGFDAPAFHREVERGEYIVG
jgi:FkbM family methyltransferase